MRVVLDTKIFVSAVLKANSLPFHVVRWTDQHGGLLQSAATEQEILSVLARPPIAGVTISSYRESLATLLAKAELVVITVGSLPAAIPTTTNFWSYPSTAVPI